MLQKMFQFIVEISLDFAFYTALMNYKIIYTYNAESSTWKLINPNYYFFYPFKL
jgi:hypothetical protein